MSPETNSSDQAGSNRVVRFDNECVLIPKTTHSKMPMVLTKSYSLPLWKKKPSDSDVEDPVDSFSSPQSPEDNRVTIKVPIPTFVLSSSTFFFIFVFKFFTFFRFKRSPQPPTPRGRSVSPTSQKSLHSCLVHRPLSPSPVKPRRPSLPIYHRRQDELTIPLRDCCADCERIIEECLKEGNDWKEKFSRGARRRRSASVDYKGSISTSSHTGNSNITKPLTIAVDEIDKRRKSCDSDKEDTDLIRTLSPPSPQLLHSSVSSLAGSSKNLRCPRVKSRDREGSSSSMGSLDELLPGHDSLHSRNLVHSSTIEEEDETQLFSLPRLPRSNTSSTPGPNRSPSSVPVRIPPYVSSIQDSDSSQESINSLSRKAENTHLATPTLSTANSSAMSATPTHSSSSSLSLQSNHMGRPTRNPRAPSTGEGAPTNKPSKVPFTIAPNSAIPSEISDQNIASAFLQAPSTSPSTDNIPMNCDDMFPSLELPTLEFSTSTPPNNNDQRKSPSLSNTHQPLITSEQKRKLSFTLPFLRAGVGAIRGVGADVLRGVNSMSNGGSLIGSV